MTIWSQAAVRKGPLCFTSVCKLADQRSLQPSGPSRTSICQGRGICSCPKEAPGRHVRERGGSALAAPSQQLLSLDPLPPPGPLTPRVPQGHPWQPGLGPESLGGKATETDAGPAGSFWDFYFFKIIHTNGYSHKHDFNPNIASLPHQQDGTRTGRTLGPTSPGQTPTARARHGPGAASSLAAARCRLRLEQGDSCQN